VQNTGRCEKIGEFAAISCYISEMVQASNVNVKSYAIYRMVSFPVTLSDPGFKVTVFSKVNI